MEMLCHLELGFPQTWFRTAFRGEYCEPEARNALVNRKKITMGLSRVVEARSSLEWK